MARVLWLAFQTFQLFCSRSFVLNGFVRGWLFWNVATHIHGHRACTADGKIFNMRRCAKKNRANTHTHAIIHTQAQHNNRQMTKTVAKIIKFHLEYIDCVEGKGRDEILIFRFASRAVASVVSTEEDNACRVGSRLDSHSAPNMSFSHRHDRGRSQSAFFPFRFFCLNHSNDYYRNLIWHVWIETWWFLFENEKLIKAD